MMMERTHLMYSLVKLSRERGGTGDDNTKVVISAGLA